VPLNSMPAPTRSALSSGKVVAVGYDELKASTARPERHGFFGQFPSEPHNAQ